MPDSRSFEDALAFGEEGEHMVARLLMQGGAIVQPVYQYKNHDRAPVLMYSCEDRVIQVTAPDLSVWSKKQALFAEVKRKNQWVDFPLAKRGLETGCNQAHFDAYCQVEQLTGQPVWVFFVHEKEPPLGIYVQRLSVLHQCERRWDGCHHKTGARFRRADGRLQQPEALFPLSRLIHRWDLPATTEAA